MTMAWHDDPPTVGTPAIARGTPTRVVAAITEKGIVRGISHFTDWQIIRAEVEKAVGVLHEAEWSYAEYRLPSYMESLGGCNGWDIASGVYLFPWADDLESDWRDPARRYSSPIGQLLFRPQGWAAGHSEPTP